MMIDRNSHRKGRSVSRRPRHIRDIAHLYLSRRRRVLDDVLRVEIAGETLTCCPAWHIANIAAALASRRIAVRVHEASSLLPNVPFYLGEPAAVYADPGNGTASADGLAGVRVSWGSAADPHDGVQVVILHLPPRDRVRPGRVTVSSPSSGVYGESWRLVLRAERDGRHLSAGRLPEGAVLLAPEPVAAARVLGADQIGRPTDAGPIASFAGWQGHVADRVPAVLAHPRSALAASYQDAGDAIISRLNTLRRRGHGQQPATVPDRTSG